MSQNSRRLLVVLLVLRATLALAGRDETTYPSLGLVAESDNLLDGATAPAKPIPRRVRRKPSSAPAQADQSKNSDDNATPTPAPKPGAGGGDVVDLSAMDATPKDPAANASSMSVHHGTSIAEPHFSIYFDLWTVYEPGKVGFTFENIHPLLFLEIAPLPNLMFSFEVNPSPRFFELDYQAASWIQLRAGKIWIPFDDMNPHSLFGGFIENSRIRLAPTAYLPDIWTDLGVGTKLTILDTAHLGLDANLYVVNGFGGSGQADPVDSRNKDFPSFADIPVSQTDYNTDKAFGGRLHALIDRKFGIAGSFYTGRWSKDSDPDARIMMFGLDSQLTLGKTQFKLGASYMSVSLLDGTIYHRQGEYIEINHKFGGKDEWMLLGRAGYLDPDDRVTNIDDTATIGGGIRWKPTLIAFELGYYQDIKYVAAKLGYTLAYFRTVIQL